MSRRIFQRTLAVLALAWALLLWVPAQSEAAGFAGSNWEVSSLWEQALSWWQGLWAQPAAETERPASREKTTGTPIPSSTSTGDATGTEESSLQNLRTERSGALDPNG